MKAVYDILVSSAETIGAFNTDFDTGNLHRPTLEAAVTVAGAGAAAAGSAGTEMAEGSAEGSEEGSAVGVVKDEAVALV